MNKVIVISAAAIIAAVVSTLVLLSASGDSGSMLFFDSMTEMMEGGRMQMQAPKDVIIFFQSESEVPAGEQTEVVLRVVDKNTDTAMKGAEVVIGIEKGLPMTKRDMMGNGMFDAQVRGDGTYAFKFTPDSPGYYTIHAHVIPPGKEMHSMIENHVDFVVISK